MPQSISLKLDVDEITSVTPKPQSEKILESDNNILPMRFSKDRDTFHTTNSKGEIVKVINPHKMFKTTLKKSEHLSKSGEHRLCPDVSFNDASYVDNMIRKLAQANIEAPEGDKVFSYINKKTCDKFSIDKSPTIYEVSDENLSLKRHLTLSFFHANLPLDWFRVKIAYSEFIKVLGLDAVLSDQPNNSELYKKQDESLAWALISLIHFPIFKQRGDEFNFWRSFRSKKQKTLYLFNFINNAVKEHLTSSTPELTINIMMRHALPEVSSIVLALDLSMDKQLIIKHYIKDPEFAQSKEPWYQIKYSTSAVRYKEQLRQMRHLREIINRFENRDENKDGDEWYDFINDDEQYLYAKTELKAYERDYYADECDYFSV